MDLLALDASEDEVESILYIAREISVYKVPPRVKAEGYRAQDWGDLARPLWKGRLRIIEKKSTGCTLNLEDSTTGEVFAKAPYTHDNPSVEAVLDSSRYFVLRIEDSGKKAYIGIGFAERTDSFDFNVALQDYAKREVAALTPPAAQGPSPHLPTGEKKDFSLKDGQTFTISIPGKAGVLGATAEKGTAGARAGGGIPLLPPPPSSSSLRRKA